MLWNSTFWRYLKLTVQIQLALRPGDPFLMKNCNMTGNIVEKYFAVWNVIQDARSTLKPNIYIFCLQHHYHCFALLEMFAYLTIRYYLRTRTKFLKPSIQLLFSIKINFGGLIFPRKVAVRGNIGTCLFVIIKIDI